jgi:hypothetical protein
MSLLTVCLCAYLLVCLTTLLEADIRVRPGVSAHSPRVVGAIFWFALSHPAVAAWRWGARFGR